MNWDNSNLGMGTSNPYLGQNNPYVNSVIGAATDDMVKSYNQTTQPAFNAAMVRSGSFGNAGVNEMNQSANDQLQKNIGNLSSSIRFQDYNNQQNMYRWDNEFNRNLYNDAYGQNMGNLSMGIGLLDTLARYNANDLNTANTVQDKPLNYLTQFSNLADTAGRGGQTAQVSTSGGGSSPLTSALGGASLGRAAQQWWNGNGGGYRNNILSTPATGFSNYDGNGGGFDAWSNYGSGGD